MKPVFTQILMKFFFYVPCKGVWSNGMTTVLHTVGSGFNSLHLHLCRNV